MGKRVADAVHGSCTPFNLLCLCILAFAGCFTPAIAVTTFPGAGQVVQAGERRLAQLALKATDSMHPCWTRLYEQFAYDTETEIGCRGGVERPAMLMLTCHLSSSGRLSNASQPLQQLYTDFIKLTRYLNTTQSSLQATNEANRVSRASPLSSERFEFDVSGIAAELSPHEFQLYSLFFAHCASICYFLLAYRHTAQVKEAVQQMQADATAAMHAMRVALERQPPGHPVREVFLGSPLLFVVTIGWLLHIRFGRWMLLVLIAIYAAGGWVAIAGMPVPLVFIRLLFWLRRRFDEPLALAHYAGS
jgi:hypothetical protein